MKINIGGHIYTVTIYHPLYCLLRVHFFFTLYAYQIYFELSLLTSYDTFLLSTNFQTAIHYESPHMNLINQPTETLCRAGYIDLVLVCKRKLQSAGATQPNLPLSAFRVLLLHPSPIYSRR